MRHCPCILNFLNFEWRLAPCAMLRRVPRSTGPLLPLPASNARRRFRSTLLAWYRAQGAGWQTRMNKVLKAYKDATR